MSLQGKLDASPGSIRAFGQTICRILAGSIVALAPGAAYAYGSYGTAFDTKYGTQGSAIAGNACTVCHTPYPARNAYGLAFAKGFTQALRDAGNVAQALANIEALDSDGDGVSNIGEIANRKYPGNAADTPPSTVLPGAPTGVSASAGNGQATVSFTAPGANGGSAITAYSVTASPGGTTVTGTASPIIVTGLTNGNEYTFTVKATSLWGYGAASTASSAITPTAPATAPTGVSAVAGNAQATVSFTAPTDNGGTPITGYTVTASPGGTTATGTASPVIVSGLSNGTAYTFTVKATNGGGSGPASAASSAVTPAALALPVPDQITSALGSNAGNGMAIIYFNPPADNGSPITGYSALCSYVGGSLATLNFTVNFAASPLILESLTNDRAYKCQLAASNAFGSSGFPNPSFTANNFGFVSGVVAQFTPSSPNPPGVPSSISAAPGDGRATLSFGPPANDGGSAILDYTAYCLAGSKSGSTSLTATGTASPLTVTGLTNGTAYACWVTARNASGTFFSLQNYSTPVSVTPAAAVYPDAPAGLSATLNGNDIVVSWNAVSGASSYNLYMANQSGVTKASYASLSGGHVHAGATSPFTHPNGTPGATYYLAVTAVNSAGESIGSAEISVTLPAPATTTTTTTTTSTTSTTSTSTASTTTTTLSGAATLNLAAGWNLLGNSSSASLDVASALGNSSSVSTVWKWIAATAKWAFYTPALGAQALLEYVTGKGYDPLTTLESGEGFWVNAKQAVALQLPAGSAVTAAALTPSGAKPLGRGWSLVAIGEARTPSEFNLALGGMNTAPANPLDIPVNLTTLWAWDALQANWYFYAPALERTGGLAAYAAGKNYLDFSAGGKKLGPGVGFWVNMP